MSRPHSSSCLTGGLLVLCATLILIVLTLIVTTTRLAMSRPHSSSCLTGGLLVLCTTLILIVLTLIVTTTREGVQQTEEILEEKLRNLSQEIHSTLDQLSQEDSRMRVTVTSTEAALKELRSSDVTSRVTTIEAKVHRILSKALSGYLSSDIQIVLGNVLRMVEFMKNPNGTVDPLCSKGWEHFGLGCYYMSVGMLQWKDAKAECERRGAHLVVIDTKEEMDFLLAFSHGTRSWVGLEEGESWVDGSPYDTTNKPWLVYNNDDYNVGHFTDYYSPVYCTLLYNGALRLYEWQYRNSYICEKKRA